MSDCDIRPKPKVWAGSPNECPLPNVWPNFGVCRGGPRNDLLDHGFKGQSHRNSRDIGFTVDCYRVFDHRILRFMFFSVTLFILMKQVRNGLRPDRPVTCTV